jgi:hypothetical protein
MTNTELIILRYISAHPMTRRGTVVDALSHGDWDAGHRIRVTLDSLVARGIVQKHGEGKRNIRYSVPPPPTQEAPIAK